MKLARVLLLAAVALPGAMAFSIGAQVLRPGLGKTCVQMCASEEASRTEKATGKNALVTKAVAFVSALCIGGAAAPSISRARDLAPEALAALSAPSTALVGQAAPPAQETKGTSPKNMNIAIGVGAVAAGGVLVPLLFRKSGTQRDNAAGHWQVMLHQLSCMFPFTLSASVFVRVSYYLELFLWCGLCLCLRLSLCLYLCECLLKHVTLFLSLPCVCLSLSLSLALSLARFCSRSLSRARSLSHTHTGTSPCPTGTDSKRRSY
jgi:hypothetical protein